MTPVPMSFSPAGIVFGVVVACFALSEVVIRAISRRNARGAGSAEHGSLVLIFLALTAGLLCGFLLAAHATFAAIPFGRVGFFVAGLVVLLAGIVLRDGSVAVLGRWFTIAVRA